ncbi:hypothetical protein C8J56DRAFT_419148 [Mycena floridula]|nr:hypothetical protein C8J56DRAFT_419148 [Mycena floridula]
MCRPPWVHLARLQLFIPEISSWDVCSSTDIYHRHDGGAGASDTELDGVLVGCGDRSVGKASDEGSELEGDEDAESLRIGDIERRRRGYEDINLEEEDEDVDHHQHPSSLAFEAQSKSLSHSQSQSTTSLRESRRGRGEEAVGLMAKEDEDL